MPHLGPAPDAPTSSQTALIVSVPEAEAVVGEHRHHLDVAASWGVPAHVTVLYPFVEPVHARDPDVLAAVRAAVGMVRAFRCSFSRTAWFDDETLWLDPDPAQPFRDLTAAVWSAFPNHPPYGGAHAAIVPHLTVAERKLGDLGALERADRMVGRSLPVRTYVDRVLLMTGARAPMSWRALDEFALAPEI
jgi:2'-5' RNA ligase superfamily